MAGRTVTRVLLVLCAWLSLAHAAPAPVVRFITTDYPPYSSRLYPGGGAMAAVVREALAVKGYRVEIDTRPWARVLRDKDKFDGVLVLWPDEVTAMSLHHYLPIFRSRVGFYTRVDTPVDTRNLAALYQRTVGIARGYGYPRVVFESGFDLVEQTDDLTNLRMLHGRRFDLVVIERPVGEHIIKTQLPEALDKLVWNEPALAEVSLGLALVRNDARSEQLHRDLDAGVAALKKSGRLAQIIRDFGVDPW